VFYYVVNCPIPIQFRKRPTTLGAAVPDVTSTSRMFGSPRRLALGTAETNRKRTALAVTELPRSAIAAVARPSS
jgi:hypothetical protein